jgi:signal transduction histidine kinase
MEAERNKWKESISENIITLNKKIYLGILISMFLIITSFIVRCDSSASNFSKILSICVVLLIIVILIVLVNKIKNSKWGDIFFILIIIFFDITLFIENCICNEGDNNTYIRTLYLSISFTLMFFNIKPDQTFKKFICMMFYKIIYFFFYLYYFNLQKSIQVYVGNDINLVILSLAMSIGQLQTKFFLFKKLEKILNDNYILYSRFKSVLPNFKYPIIKIDFLHLEVLYNNSFQTFLKDNLSEEELQLKAVCQDEIKDMETKRSLNTDINEVLENCDRCFLEDIEKNIQEKEQLLKFKNFKNIILILHKLFKKFLKESNTSIENTHYLNLFDILRENDDDVNHQQTFRLLLPERFVEIEWIRSSCVDSKSIVQISLNDVTEERKKEIIRDEMKSNKVFLAKLAHEFKTPMNCLIYKVKKFTEKFNELSEKTGIDNEKCLRYLNKSSKFIESQANFLNILVHDINDFCKEINDLEINMTSVDIRYLIKFSFDILKSLVNNDEAKRNNIKLHLSVDEKLPETIITDEKRLKQLLINLISNAVKFTNFGHIKLMVKSLPEYGKDSQKEFFFEVEDTGIGISEEHQKKLFYEFQSDLNKKYTNLNKDGSGLGLSICKRIIEKLGREIKCESKNEYTKFSFVIFDKSEKRRECTESICKTEDGYYRQETKPYKDGFNIMGLDSKIFDSHSCVDKEVSCSLISPKSYDTKFNEIRMKPQKKFETDRNSRKTFKFSQDFCSEEHESILNKKTRGTSEIETTLSRLIDNKDYSIYKKNYLSFNRSLVKYMKYIMGSSIKYSKFLLIVDDERINAKALKKLIKAFFKEKNINDISIIIISDGIECLNILYYDVMFFMRVFLVISDLNMKFLNGDCLFKFITKTQALNKIKFALYTNTEMELLKNLGIKYFLQKPCTKSEIEELYNNVRSNQV